MVSIIKAVEVGARKAQHKAPREVFVTRSNSDVAVLKDGVVVSLRNWVVNTRTGNANCEVCHTIRGVNDDDCLSHTGRSTLRGGSIEEIIWSVVMAVAMGAYDHVPD